MKWPLGHNFELFTHITRFCGHKVVLLWLYNGPGLEHEPEEDMGTYSRSTEVDIGVDCFLGLHHLKLLHTVCINYSQPDAST